MSQRILVTGATGTIGSALVRALQARGADFAVMTSKPATRTDGVPVVVADFADRASLDRAFASVHTLFLLLPLVPNKRVLARHAVDAAQAAGIKHIVRSSGAGADSQSPVAIARLQGEIDDMVRASGIPFTLLQPNSFMQNHVTFNAAQIRAGAYYAPHGNSATSVVDARDVADAADAVLSNPAAHAGKHYTLTGPEALTDAEQMAEISRALGRTVKYVDVPDAAAVDAMNQYGVAPELIEWLMSLHHVIKQGWAAGVTTDVQALTGQAPRTFAAYAREHVSAWR